MMLYKHREKFQKLSIWIGMLFSRLRLSPNQWTMLSFLPAIVSFYFLITEDFFSATFFFGISAFFDLIDGSVARVTGKVTKKGAYLDTVVDRYIEFIALLALLFVALPSYVLPAYAWIFVYLFGAMMTTYAKAAAKEKELVEKELRGGILERTERLIFLFIGILLANFSKQYLVYAIAILAILANITALQRILAAMKEK